MLQLKLQVRTVVTETGQVAEITDVTDWSQAVSVRGTWALFLAGTKLGSVQDQDSELDAPSYDPHTFQSGLNPAGTVSVPLPGNGVFRFQAVAVPVVLTDSEMLLATAGRVYYRLDTGQFVFKGTGGQLLPVTTWQDILTASQTDTTAFDGNLLDKSGDGYALGTYGLGVGLGLLNLRYLEAGKSRRQILKRHYEEADLHVRGAERQFTLGFYADASTTIRAAEYLLGSCLPEYAQSMPAIATPACGCD